MKTYKFRWQGADGDYHYKEFTFPDDAALCVGLNEHGHEIYDGDVFDNTHKNKLGVNDGAPMAAVLRLEFYDVRGNGYYHKDPKFTWYF